jgi:glyceraldehyde 3-phosphate dehydrogenase/D-erythrose 4-phosphate dehydrogenase
VLRALAESGDKQDALQVVAINEPAELETIAHLLKYDSTHGRFPGEVNTVPGKLLINDHEISISHEEHIKNVPWQDMAVDLVLECSGVLDRAEQARPFIERGAKRVLFSQPADPAVDLTVVYGFNHTRLATDMQIISGASCTTNCIVPVIDVLHQAFAIESGVITTIHSAMNDQPVIDAYHHTDLRKTRAAMQSIIPVDTELARGIDRLMPVLKGRFEAQALRVPTINVSAMDLSVQVEKDVTVDAVNEALAEATRSHYAGILGFTTEPLASCDFNHDSRSGIIDGSQTRVGGKRLVKVLVWFDNEWAYANRMLDIAETLAGL